jgi:hypothetical protein
MVIWAAPFLTGLVLLTVWWQSGLLASLGVALPWNIKPLLLVLTSVFWILRTLYR